MDILGQYTIHWKGLSLGSHDFDFKVDGRLFRAFESPDIKDGNANVAITLRKSETMLLLDVSITGNVTVECDRCLDDLDIPVDFYEELKVKFSEEEQEPDDEVIWIHPGESDLPLAQYIYDSIVLSLPYSRVHGEGADGNLLCDGEMMSRFRIVSDEEFSEIESATESASLGEGPEGDKLRELKEKMVQK